MKKLFPDVCRWNWILEQWLKLPFCTPRRCIWNTTFPLEIQKRDPEVHILSIPVVTVIFPFYFSRYLIQETGQWHQSEEVIVSIMGTFFSAKKKKDQIVSSSRWEDGNLIRDEAVFSDMWLAYFASFFFFFVCGCFLTSISTTRFYASLPSKLGRALISWNGGGVSFHFMQSLKLTKCVSVYFVRSSSVKNISYRSWQNEWQKYQLYHRLPWFVLFETVFLQFLSV